MDLPKDPPPVRRGLSKSFSDDPLVADVAPAPSRGKMRRQSSVPDSLLRQQAVAARRLVDELQRQDSEQSPKILEDEEFQRPGQLQRGGSVALQGDLSFYEEEALGQRAFLMEHPDLIAMTSQMWQELDTVVDDSGSGELFLLEEQYIGMHRAMTKALVAGVKDGDLDGLARNDWTSDTERLGHSKTIVVEDEGAEPRSMVVKCLGEDGFRRSVMEMADLWTTSVDTHEYKGFLTILNTIVVENAQKEKKAGKSRKSKEFKNRRRTQKTALELDPEELSSPTEKSAKKKVPLTRASVTPTKAAPVTSAPPAAHCNPETPIVDVATPYSPPALLSPEPSSPRSLESPRSKLLQKFKPADVVEESVAVEAKEEEDGPILSDRRTPRRKGSGGAGSLPSSTPEGHIEVPQGEQAPAATALSAHPPKGAAAPLDGAVNRPNPPVSSRVSFDGDQKTIASNDSPRQFVTNVPAPIEQAPKEVVLGSGASDRVGFGVSVVTLAPKGRLRLRSAHRSRLSSGIVRSRPMSPTGIRQDNLSMPGQGVAFPLLEPVSPSVAGSFSPATSPTLSPSPLLSASNSSYQQPIAALSSPMQSPTRSTSNSRPTTASHRTSGGGGGDGQVPSDLVEEFENNRGQNSGLMGRVMRRAPNEGNRQAGPGSGAHSSKGRRRSRSGSRSSFSNNNPSTSVRVSRTSSRVNSKDDVLAEVSEAEFALLLREAAGVDLSGLPGVGLSPGSVNAPPGSSSSSSSKLASPSRATAWGSCVGSSINSLSSSSSSYSVRADEAVSPIRNQPLPSSGLGSGGVGGGGSGGGGANRSTAPVYTLSPVIIGKRPAGGGGGRLLKPSSTSSRGRLTRSASEGDGRMMLARINPWAAELHSLVQHEFFGRPAAAAAAAAAVAPQELCPPAEEAIAPPPWPPSVSAQASVECP